MNQLTLFPPEASKKQSAAAPTGPRNQYVRMEALMACPVVEAKLLEIFRTRPTDWLDWSAFWPVIEKHSVGFGLGHKLYSMVRRGLLEEKVIYLGRGIGADRPGSPDYCGFRNEYRLASAAHEREAVRAP